MFQKGDAIEIVGDHPEAGKSGTFKWYSKLQMPGRECVVMLQPQGRQCNERKVYLDAKFITMATSKKSVTEEISTAAAAPAAKTKPRAEKAKRNFGKDAEVIVINPESTYHNIVGTVLNEVASKPGYYLVRFPEPTGQHILFANELDLNDKPAPTATSGVVAQLPATELPLSQITADTQQPRHQFDEAALQELADSIKEHGVLQAIVVRPNPFLISKDEFPYCIVFGERRYRAAQMAGLTAIPAVIRELTEIQALELQIIENLQRKDVHPMEEGLAFKRLLDGKSDIDALRLKIGVSPKYIATRIKLTDLTAQWQKAFLEDKIDFGQAIRLAKLDQKTQGMFYKDATKGDRRELQLSGYSLDDAIRKTNHNLDKAPFKIEDATLNPDMGPCGPCPFNTSNTPRLFMGEERICTNSACYAIKEKNSYKKKLEKAAKEPDVIFLDNSYYQGEEDKKKLAVVKDMNVQLVKRDEIITAPTDPGPKPEWEAYLKERKEEYDEHFEDGDDPFDEAEVKEDFKEELTDWEENMAEFEAFHKPGATRKAFVVIGNNAGKYVDVILKADHPEISDEGGSNPIAEIEKREARAKELDNEKVYKQVTPLITAHEGFLNSSQPLSKEETAALTVYLIDTASFKSRGWLEDELGVKNSWDAEVYHKALNEMLPGTFNQFVRKMLSDRLVTANELDYGRKAKPAAMMGIARQYLPKEVTEIELLQKDKAIKRQKRVNERIAELRAAQEKEVAGES